MWAHTKETQEKISPRQALQYLQEGNLRFQSNLKADRNLLRQVNQTAEGQFPFATILSCMDSRTSAEIIFDQGLGDVFSIRVAGNVLNRDIIGSIEYACGIAGSKIVVVLGHTKCGAVISACNAVKMGYLTGLINKINPAIQAEKTVLNNRSGSNTEFVNKVSELHVRHTIGQIRKLSSVLNTLEAEESLLIVGGMYDIDTGQVRFFECKDKPL